MCEITAKPPHPQELHSLGLLVIGSWSDMPNICVEYGDNPCIPVMRDGAVLVILVRKDHDIGASTWVDGVLITAEVVSGIIYPHNFMSIGAVLDDVDIEQVLIRGLGLVSVVRKAQ